MSNGSEYDFPIFISSPVFNLLDLRAELARHLAELGYRPVLSSAEGFHDRTALEPWESCLPVLESCYVVVLILDGRYGKALPWPNYTSEMKNQEISPTHGEFRHSIATRKRLLVFARQSLNEAYQLYRNTFNNKTPDASLQDGLRKMLPEQIEFEALSFYSEVKIARPWIRLFSDVTDLKREVQKKLLNELAEEFLFRENKMAGVIAKLGNALDALAQEDRVRVLREVGVTRVLIDENEKRAELLKEQEANLDRLRAELTSKEEEARRASEATQERRKLEAQLEKLKTELDTLKTQNVATQLEKSRELVQSLTTPMPASSSELERLLALSGTSIGLPPLFDSSSLYSSSVLGKYHFPGLDTYFGISTNKSDDKK